MRNNWIISYWVKRFHAKNHTRNYQSLTQATFNLLKRNFKVNKSNEKWVTDITYIRIHYQRKYLYLSTIIDLYNREIIAYKISEDNLVIDTLKAALNSKTKAKIEWFNTAFWSRSSIYFHSILKKETIYNKFIKTKHDMINLIHEWIKFY